MAVGADQVQVKFGADVGSAVAGIQQVGSQLKGLAASAGIATGALDAMKGALLSVLGPLLIIGEVGQLVGMVSGAARAAQTLANVSSASGIASATIVNLSREITLFGGNATAAQGAATRFGRALGQAEAGNTKLSQLFQRLGVDIHGAGSETDKFEQAMRGISALPNPAERQAAAFQLFRFQAQALLPVLNATAEQHERVKQTIAEFSAQIPTLGAHLRELAYQQNANTLADGALSRMLQDAVAPAMSAVEQTANDMIAGMVESYNTGGAMKVIFDALGLTVKLIAASFEILGGVVKILTDYINTSLHFWTDLGRGIANNVEHSTQFQNAIHGIEQALNRVKPLLDWLKNTFGSIGDAISGAAHKVGDFVSGLIDRIPGGRAALADLQHGVQQIGQDAQDALHHVQELFTAGPQAALTQSPEDQAAAAEATRAQLRQQLQDRIAALNYQQELAHDDFNQQMAIEQQKVDMIRGFYGESSREYQDALRNQERMQLAHNQELVRIEQQHIQQVSQLEVEHANATEQLTTIDIANRRRALQERAANFQISQQQLLDGEAQLVNEEVAAEQQKAQRIHQIQVQAIQDQLALLPPQSAAAQELNAELARIEAQWQDQWTVLQAQGDARRQQATETAAKLQQNTWRQAWMSMQNTFSQSLTGLIEGTKSFAQVWNSILDQMIQMFSNMVVENVMKWLWQEHGKTAATAAGTTERLALEAGAHAMSLAMSAATALGDIANSAARAAAGAYAALASIPVVGPVLAPAAAAAALAAVLALGKSLFSAEGGWGQVPQDGMLTALHKNEMVLPASIASPLRSQLARASDGGVFGGDSQGGDTHHHWNVSAIDGQSVARFFRENADQLASALARQSRSFAGYANAARIA